MQWYIPTIAAQFDLIGGTLGVVVAIVVSFAIITLIASYYRFQNIVQMAENTEPEEMGAAPVEILRVQLARYLAGCARRGTSFSVVLIQTGNPDVEVRMDANFITSIKESARRGDVTCVYDEHTAVLIAESEPEDAQSILGRIISRVAKTCDGITDDSIRAGVASYPGHGLSGKELMQIAVSGLEQATAETPIILPEIVDLEEEEGVEEEEIPEAQNISSDLDDFDEDLDDEGDDAEDGESGAKGWKERRKNAMLDELTGVLKPSAVSAYMQRVMSEYRRKKDPAALFCIGVNNMEYIARFHGVEAAETLLAGVCGIFQENLRADDLIGRHEKYAFLVLAQCSIAEAEIIGKRITTLVQNSAFEFENKKLKTTITLGVATFPEHGHNLHHLYTAGQKVLDHSRANDIRAYAVFDPKIHDTMPSKPMKSIKSFRA